MFQKTIDMVFEGINRCKSTTDDMLVWGSSKEEHDQNLRKVLEHTREAGIKCNAEKWVFGATKVSYFGHVLSDKGVQPDPSSLSCQTYEPVLHLTLTCSSLSPSSKRGGQITETVVHLQQNPSGTTGMNSL